MYKCLRPFCIIVFFTTIFINYARIALLGENISAEKNIVDYWLNQKGFSTVKNIKISNRDIGILALKPENNVTKFYHIEVACSLTSGLTEKDIKKGIITFIDKTFNDETIAKGVNNTIKNICGEKQDYQRILVLSNLPVSREDEIINEFREKSINIFKFEDIMADVILELDTQYYKDDILRTLQLTKYLLLAQPEKLAMLLDKTSQYSVFNQKTRQRFIDIFLTQDEKMLRNLDIAQITQLIKHSKLKDPEQLADVIVKELLGSKSRKRFMEAMVSQEGMQSVFKKPVALHEVKEQLEKKHKPLMSFFS